MKSLPDDHAALWRRLESFQFDNAGSAVTFAGKLARENGWTDDFARRVAQEFLRFVFLTQTAGHPVCPSEEVDQAWHLHLTHTHSYWHSLCRDVLGQPLHHVPSRGGQAEHQKHAAMYEQTLAAYRDIFGHDAPADIWPAAEFRFGGAHARVDRRAYWVIPKPSFLTNGKSQQRAGVVAFAAVAPLLGALNPFDLPGPQFLALYAVLFVVGLFISVKMRAPAPPKRGVKRRKELTASEIACLKFNKFAAVNAAISSLVEAGYLRTEQGDKRGLLGLSKGEVLFFPGAELPNHATPLECAIYSATNAETGATFGALQEAGSAEADKIAAVLKEEGCWYEPPLQGARLWVPFLIMLSLLIMGAVEIAVGLQRDKPVIFLIVFCLVGLVVTIFVLKPRRHTMHAKKILRRFERQFEHLRNLDRPQVSASDVALAAALFGVSALSAERHSDLKRAWTSHMAAHGGGSSCSSGGSGCGGGGGGCGGGGCGGCGGGGD